VSLYRRPARADPLARSHATLESMQ